MIFHTIMSLKSKEWIFFVNISAFWKVIIGYNRSIDKHNFLFVANFLHLKLISGLLDSFDKFQKSDLNVMFDICSNYWVKLQNLLFLFFNFNPSWFSMTKFTRKNSFSDCKREVQNRSKADGQKWSPNEPSKCLRMWHENDKNELDCVHGRIEPTLDSIDKTSQRSIHLLLLNLESILPNFFSS